MTGRARRRLLALPLLAAHARPRAAAAPAAPPTPRPPAQPTAPPALPFPGEPAPFHAVEAGRRLAFPRDFGAHRGFRIEWWYLTGWLRDTATSRPFGFQLTFFRIGTRYPRGNPSRFAPTDLIAAHAALMDPTLGRPLIAERLVNAGGAGVVLDERDTRIVVGDWSLARDPDDRYRARVASRGFAFSLALASAHPTPWLQGEDGYSRKGPLPSQASHYYSRTQLATTGSVVIDGRTRPVSGVAWFDHEWSSTLLADDAAGWDWAGLNLHDGRSIVWFVVRREKGTTPLRAYAALREADGSTRMLLPEPARALQYWQSPTTGARYPVALALRLRSPDASPALALTLQPLMPDQEIDSRATTGNVYWEGAVRVLDEGQAEVGVGYLELTGYHRRIRI
ncbi:MAG: lipocalin-like domain-containing protein [Lautropia sp.]